MKIEKAIEILETHNKWRRDNEGIYEMQKPKEIGEAIDTVLDLVKNNVSLGVSKSVCLLNRKFHECEVHRCSTYGCLNCGQYKTN